jgi:hypothetical protein
MDPTRATGLYPPLDPPDYLRSNLLFAAVAMVLSLWLFLPFALALLCVVTVIWTDTLVLGLMALAGMRLNCTLWLWCPFYPR